jgi:CubicO group peptidase (beta-lactamase class C family)
MKIVKLMSIFAAAIFLQGCLTEPDLKKPFEGFTPQEINDGWEISSPAAEGIDSAGLVNVFQDFHNNKDIWQVRSLSVYRHGKLVAESYTKDESDRVKPRAIWSATKQVMGVLVGIAIDKGYIESVDDKIVKYLPDELEDYPNKQSITIKDLLTMRSGIDYNNYGLSGDDSKILQRIPDNYLNFILKKDLVTAPGTEFEYKDSDPQLLSSIIQKVTGKKADVWADEVLFSKIGLDNYEWERYKDGTTLGSFGIMTTPREMAKIAKLVLNGGTWNNQQIVSQSWIDEMKAPLIESGDKHFGYLWWSYPEHDTYFMSGNGRQLAFVFPAKELVVVITSEANVQGKFNLSTPAGRKIGERILDLCD